MKTDTVKVRSFAYRNDAEFAQQLLHAEQIESQLKGDDASGWLPNIGLGTGGFSLWVMEGNEEKALQILADRFDSSDAEVDKTT